MVAAPVAAAAAPAAAAASALMHPLEVVDELFHAWTATHGSPPGEEWGEREHFVKALGLQDEQAFAHIPCLNDQALADAVRPFSLVRYRALVQDVFEPEIYVSQMEEVGVGEGASSRPPRIVTTKYRERVEPRPGYELRECGREGLSQRGACYCVPIPGETAWAKEASARLAREHHQVDSLSASPLDAAASAAGSKKRSRADEDVDMDAGDASTAPGGAEVTPPPVQRSRAAETGRKTAQPGSLGGGGAAAGNGDSFGLNLPLPWEERRGHGSSTACIVKLYGSDAESLRLCETVEILGVLCVSPELASFGDEGRHPLFGGDARHPSASLVPRLHALLVRRLPHFHPLLPFSPDWLSEARLAAAYAAQLGAPSAVAMARAAALARLTRSLNGDAAAAEYTLMLLASRSFGKCGDQSLGCWSLNLARWPQEVPVTQLSQAVADLAPRVVQLELGVEALNTRRWLPTKDFEANRLVAGQLQLAPGTLLVLDETSLSEGQVSAPGLKALNGVKDLVTSRALTCDFQVQTVQVPLELSCLSVSRGRSIIKGFDALLPVNFSAPEAAALQDAGSLEPVRLLLGLVTRSPKALNIPEAVANQVGRDFAEVRGAMQVPSELIHTWMGMARAHCLTYGENELTVERWQFVLQLERERLRRCAAAGMGLQ